MKIPYVNLLQQHKQLRSDLLVSIERVLDHGRFILGPEVEEFEAQFAEFAGTKYAVGVNSGLDALVLALRALAIGPGDEVITVPNSFIATAAAIELSGARPVFVDVGEDFNMDVTKVELAITPKTKALLPVHLTGRPAQMGALQQIASKYKLFIIEDAAQSVGATYAGQPAGSLGNFGCFSLHPLKTLSACGDGGIVTTNDAPQMERLKLLRNHGLKTRENALFFAANSRLDSIQAAILLGKLPHVKDWSEKRRLNAGYYRDHLFGVGDLVLPMDKPEEYAVYHTFILQTRQRDELKQFLWEQGIETAIHYPIPIHLQEAGSHLGYPKGSFPVAEQQAERILSLPIYPELNAHELDYIVDAIHKFFSR